MGVGPGVICVAYLLSCLFLGPEMGDAPPRSLWDLMPALLGEAGVLVSLGIFELPFIISGDKGIF